MTKLLAKVGWKFTFNKTNKGEYLLGAGQLHYLNLLSSRYSHY